MGRMMQRTLAAAAIAGVCVFFLLMPGTSRAGEVSGPESGGPIYDCYGDEDCFIGYECLYGYCVSSADICQLNYSAFGDSDTLKTGEQSKTYTAAAELLVSTLYDPVCHLQTRESILDSCSGGCCSATCFPVTTKACTDGTAYSALRCQGESCDYTLAGTWDVVCEGEECQDASDCSEGYACVDGACVADQPPVFLSEPLWVGAWVGLSSDPANPNKPQSKDILFWAYNDDKLACPGGVELSWMYRPVELQAGEVVALGDGDWVLKEPWRFLWFVWIETPGIADIVGSGLFEFKMVATDCMGQMTDSEGFWGKRYYFQVD